MAGGVRARHAMLEGDSYPELACCASAVCGRLQGRDSVLGQRDGLH